MQSIDFVHPGVFQHAGLNHGFGPTKHFLSGLEEKHSRAGDISAPGRQDFCQCDSNRGMPVMPTGVHDSRCV